MMKNLKNFNQLITYAIIIFALLFYIFFSLKHLDLPGTQDDETIIGTSCFPLLGKPSFGTTNITIFKKEIPLLYHSYHAAGAAYFIAPFLKLFGINVFALRFATVFYGLLTIVLFYILMLKYTNNKKHAALAVFILATHPTFIISCRIGALYNSLHMLFAIMSFLFYLYWKKTGYILPLISGTFALCFGLSIHTSFIYFVFAVLTLAIIFRYCIFRNKLFNRQSLTILIITFILGNSLFIVGNIKNNYSTLISFKNNFINTDSKFTNTSYIRNLSRRFGDIESLLDSSGIQSRQRLHNHYMMNNYRDPFEEESNPLYLLIFIFSIIYILFKNTRNKKAFFILIFCILYIIYSPFTLSAFTENHIIVILPFAIMLISYLIYRLIHRKNIFIKFLGLLIVTLLLINNYLILSNYHNFIQKTGGIRLFSDAIYELSYWIKKNNIKDIILCDWGPHNNLVFHTQGVFRPKVFYTDDLSNHNYSKEISKLFNNSKNIYVFLNESPNINYFNRIAQENSERLILVKEFFQRDGICIYKVFKLSKKKITK